MNVYMLILLLFVGNIARATDSIAMQATTSISIEATSTVATASVNSQANCQSNGGQYSFTLNTLDPTSNSGHSETGSATIYVPILNTDSANFNCMYLEKSNSSISGAIVKPLSRGSAGAAPTSSDTINFPITVTVSSTAKYIWGAVKDGSAYKVISQSGGTFQDQNLLATTYTVSPAQICNGAQTIASCSTVAGTGLLLENSTALASSPVTLNVFLFLDDQIHAIGDTITDTNYTGVYYQVIMSNSIPSAVPTISNSKRGDGRVILTYSGSPVMGTDFFNKIGIFAESASSVTSNQIGVYTTGNKVVGDFSTSQSGDAAITGLSNGTTYHLSIYFLDKFGFATLLSPTVEGYPTEIAQLLKKQNCYLLTAGFGEEHYVIEYFRHFRDETLINFWVGRKFINFYYKTAPKYALSVYNNETIRFIIRCFAYSLYFLFNSFWWILMGFLFILINIFYKKYRARIEH